MTAFTYTANLARRALKGIRRRLRAEAPCKRVIGLQCVRIDLGAPSKDCRNFGVCQIEPLNTPPRGETRLDYKKGIAFVFLKSWTELDFHFFNASLHPRTAKHYFRENVFRVDETFTCFLRGQVSGGIVKVTVPAGEYALSNTLSARIVHFAGVSTEVIRTASAGAGEGEPCRPVNQLTESIQE